MLFFISLVLLLTCRSALGICEKECNEPTLIYESLKCKPVYASPTDCCPIKYNCSEFEARVHKDDVCYFDGRAYNVNERVNDDAVSSNCATLVRCTKEKSGLANFIRAVVDCFTQNAGRGCHNTYELNKCCSSGKTCAPYATTCTVDGKTYHEGMRFDHPTEKCTACICKDGYNGQSEEPYCTKKKCIEEVTHQHSVYNLCAPVYWKKDDCCPGYWICPEEDDVKNIFLTSSGEKCTYGKFKMNIGDNFTRDYDDDGSTTVCECKIPPFVTCNIENK